MMRSGGRLDDMPAETVEGAGAGTAGVDKGGGSAAPRHFNGIDPERSAAPIDVGVEVDQPGHDEEPAHIHNLGPDALQFAPDLGHLSVCKGYVGYSIAAARRIDNAPILKDQVCHLLPAPGKIQYYTSRCLQGNFSGSRRSRPVSRPQPGTEPCRNVGH
jgi:hypothetical protein